MHRRVGDASHTRETSNLPLGPAVVCNHVHTNVGAPIDDGRHCQRGAMTFPFVYAIRRTNDKSPWILTRSRARFGRNRRVDMHGVSWKNRGFSERQTPGGARWGNRVRVVFQRWRVVESSSSLESRRLKGLSNRSVIKGEGKDEEKWIFIGIIFKGTIYIFNNDFVYILCVFLKDLSFCY